MQGATPQGVLNAKPVMLGFKSGVLKTQLVMSGSNFRVLKSAKTRFLNDMK
jgi:hypothetical protein